MINKDLKEEWKMQRIDQKMREILREGEWELKERKDVKKEVIVQEYVDIEKELYKEEEKKMVNEVMDRIELVIRGERRGEKKRNKR